MIKLLVLYNKPADVVTVSESLASVQKLDYVGGLAYLGALVEKNDGVPCRAALEAVQAYERRGHDKEVDKSLRTYADFVDKEYQLAVKHSQRKGSARSSAQP